jgi:hypothetical protein
MMFKDTTPSHSDYEVDDVVRVKTATCELLVRIDDKLDDVTKEPDRQARPGWVGEVVEVLDAMYPSSNGNTPGTNMWGKASQVKEVK